MWVKKIARTGQAAIVSSPSPYDTEFDETRVMCNIIFGEGPFTENFSETVGKTASVR